MNVGICMGGNREPIPRIVDVLFAGGDQLRLLGQPVLRRKELNVFLSVFSLYFTSSKAFFYLVLQ